MRGDRALACRVDGLCRTAVRSTAFCHANGPAANSCGRGVRNLPLAAQLLHSGHIAVSTARQAALPVSAMVGRSPRRVHEDRFDTGSGQVSLPPSWLARAGCAGDVSWQQNVWNRGVPSDPRRRAPVRSALIDQGRWPTVRAGRVWISESAGRPLVATSPQARSRGRFRRSVGCARFRAGVENQQS